MSRRDQSPAARKARADERRARWAAERGPRPHVELPWATATSREILEDMARFVHPSLPPRTRHHGIDFAR